jgi:hypothetical protein
MSFEIKINEQLLKDLEQIPLTLRAGPLDRCLKAYGKPIADYAKTIAPRSRSSGTRKKWSAMYKKYAAYQNNSGDNFGVKVMKSAVGVVVGAKYPRGNKQQFVHPFKHGDAYKRHILWGKKEADRPLRFPRNEQPIVKAFQATRSAAEAAFRTQFEKEIKELKLG